MSPSQTAIVIDTTAYLPDALVRRHDLHLVSLHVTLDGTTQPESELSDYDTFYERLGRSEEGATTSQPSVGEFVSAYEPLLAAGRDVVSVHISAALSGTCGSARQARQRLIDEDKGGERVHVYDSRSVAGGMALVVLGAIRAAETGASGEEVCAHLDETRARMKMWFALDTLEYLRKGGRIGAAQAWIGSTLRVKPILTMEEEITPVERVRTRRRAVERMIDFARERQREGADGWVVQHIHDHEAAQTLVEHCREVFGNPPLFVSEVGPVLGAHAGPGMIGIGSAPRHMVAND